MLTKREGTIQSETMRAALLILSILTILIGIWAGLGHFVIHAPPESSIHEARRELGKLPLPEADVERLQKLLDQGVARSRGECRRLSEHLNAVYVTAFIVGAAGLFYGILGGKRKTVARTEEDGAM